MSAMIASIEAVEMFPGQLLQSLTMQRSRALPIGSNLK